MSYISQQCEQWLETDGQETIISKYLQMRETLLKSHPLLANNDEFWLKLKVFAAKTVLIEKIHETHKEIYGCEILHSDCLCSLCTLGFSVIYQMPFMKLATELGKIMENIEDIKVTANSN